MNQKYILGISCFYHDASATLIKDGHILSAVQEERFTRIKFDPNFPINSINYCLETTAEGNEVVFQGKKNMPNRKYKGFHSPLLEIAPENNNIYIHYGNHPHYTKNLLSGYRYSIIIWLDKSN